LDRTPCCVAFSNRRFSGSMARMNNMAIEGHIDATPSYD
jgi:hypothetical protein